MAKGLYIMSVPAFAGKSMLSIGMGLRFQQEGISFNYMKPMTIASQDDDMDPLGADAAFVCEMLGITAPAEMVCPVQLTSDDTMRFFSGQGKDLLPTVRKAYNSLAANRDLMLVGGTGDMFTGKHCGLDAYRLCRELGLRLLVVDRVTEEVHYDALLAIKEKGGDMPLGVVLNDVPPQMMEEMEKVIKPFLERHGLPVMGIIPGDPLLRSVRAAELAELLGGKLVTAQNNANRMVENFLIGTMQVDNFMTYFRRHPDSAVIVGGDRADVQLVAIEGECPCLILTGNLCPNDILLSRADTLKVPVIMVRGDTYSVANRMENILGHYKMRDVQKMEQVRHLVASHMDFPKLKAALAL